MNEDSKSGLQRLHEKIIALKAGSRRVGFQGRIYLLSVQRYANGGVVKIWAKELGGNDFISANYYPTLKLLKPCEMPKRKVEKFLQEVE